MDHSSLREMNLSLQMKLWSPGDLQPSACVVLRTTYVRGDQESLVLCEGLYLPVPIECIGAIHETIRYGAAVG